MPPDPERTAERMRHLLDPILVTSVEQAVSTPFAIRQLAFAALDAEQATALLGQTGIASARLRTPEDFTRCPQLCAWRRLRRVCAPGGGIEALLPPVEAAGQKPVIEPVPAVGEHTAAVRAEFGAATRADVAT
jgi:crotonobetainyl-CoA:carnitine CoA-transferase CaiB-like acyl-CoA transferase